jgi:hypothetical protein
LLIFRVVERARSEERKTYAEDTENAEFAEEENPGPRYKIGIWGTRGKAKNENRNSKNEERRAQSAKRKA